MGRGRRAFFARNSCRRLVGHIEGYATTRVCLPWEGKRAGFCCPGVNRPRLAALPAQISHRHHALLVPLHRAAEVVCGADRRCAWPAAAVERLALVADRVRAVRQATQALVTTANAAFRRSCARKPVRQTLALANAVGAVAGATIARTPAKLSVLRAACRPAGPVGACSAATAPRRGASGSVGVTLPAASAESVAAGARATFGGGRTAEAVSLANRLGAALLLAFAAATRAAEITELASG